MLADAPSPAAGNSGNSAVAVASGGVEAEAVAPWLSADAAGGFTSQYATPISYYDDGERFVLYFGRVFHVLLRVFGHPREHIKDALLRAERDGILNALVSRGQLDPNWLQAEFQRLRASSPGGSGWLA